jgi:hypothetical protein
VCIQKSIDPPVGVGMMLRMNPKRAGTNGKKQKAWHNYLIWASK